MQTVSAAYKEQMRRPLRNRSYVRVSYGVFNILAGQQASFADNGHTVYASLNLNDDVLPDRDYATFEKDYWRADGKQLILPAASPYNYDGFVSSVVSGDNNTFSSNPTITVSFTDPQDIFGLTFTFPEGQVPQEIKVNGTAYNPDSELYVMPDRLQDVTEIQIEFVKAPAAGRRVRLNRLQFGQSVVFQNRQLIKTSFESSIDFLSLSLTQKKFTFTIDNRDQAYNPLNPTGIYSYLEAKQPLDMEYGYELDDGSIEWVQGDSTVSESTPIAADAQASFSAVDALTNLTGMFRHGLYRENRNLIDNNFSAWESGQYQPSDGGKADNTSRLRLSELVAVKPSTTYYCNTESENFQEVIRTYDSSRNFLSSIGAIQNGQTFTTPAGAYFISVTLFNSLDETIAYDYQSLFADGTIKPFMCLNSIVDKSYAPHDNKISLYDLAAEVLTDAGVEHYVIDDHLKDVYTKAALPVATHRECLQIIANAGQCILYTDRRGYIKLEIALDPTITIGDNGHTAFSDSDSAYNDEDLPTAKYAEFLPDSWKAAGAKILFSAAGPYIRQGFVSNKICGADGVFSTYPVFFWTYSFPYSAYQIPITFDNVDGEYATDFDVVYKLGGAEIDRVSVTGNTAVKYIVEHSVDKTDRIDIEIHKWSVGTRRAMIAQIGSGRVNDMNIDFSTATAKPVVEKSSQVKTVTVNCYGYTPAAAATELYHENITPSGPVMLNISHDAAAELSASVTGVDDGNGNISQTDAVITSQTHYTYYSAVTLTGTQPATLKLTGKVLTTSSVGVVKQLNPQGEDKPALTNPLITDLTNAQNTAIWIADYFSKRNFLTTTYRGNPEIDAHDLVYMESQFEALFPARIMEHKIEFNGALSGSVKAVKMNG